MRKLLLLSTVFIVAGVLLSCNKFFMPVTANTNSIDSTKKLLHDMLSTKYIIVRNGSQNAEFADLVLDDTNNSLTGKLKEVGTDHQLYLYAPKKHFEYEKSDATKILSEVHLYTNMPLVKDSTSKAFSLPIASIEKIEIIQPDVKKTHDSKVLGNVLFGVVAVLTLLVIAAMVWYVAESI